MIGCYHNICGEVGTLRQVYFDISMNLTIRQQQNCLQFTLCTNSVIQDMNRADEVHVSPPCAYTPPPSLVRTRIVLVDIKAGIQCTKRLIIRLISSNLARSAYLLKGLYIFIEFEMSMSIGDNLTNDNRDRPRPISVVVSQIITEFGECVGL